MKNIGILLQKGFPPDIRVEKEASALVKASCASAGMGIVLYW